MEKNKQSYAIKFCVRLGKSATDAYIETQKTFDNNSVSRAQIFLWHKDFVQGREAVEVEP